MLGIRVSKNRLYVWFVSLFFEMFVIIKFSNLDRYGVNDQNPGSQSRYQPPPTTPSPSATPGNTNSSTVIGHHTPPASNSQQTNNQPPHQVFDNEHNFHNSI